MKVRVNPNTYQVDVERMQLEKEKLYEVEIIDDIDYLTNSKLAVMEDGSLCVLITNLEDGYMIAASQYNVRYDAWL